MSNLEGAVEAVLDVVTGGVPVPLPAPVRSELVRICLHPVSSNSPDLWEVRHQLIVAGLRVPNLGVEEVLSLVSRGRTILPLYALVLALLSAPGRSGVVSDLVRRTYTSTTLSRHVTLDVVARLLDTPDHTLRALGVAILCAPGSLTAAEVLVRSLSPAELEVLLTLARDDRRSVSFLPLGRLGSLVDTVRSLGV